MFSAVLFFRDEGMSAAVENLAIESKVVFFQKTLGRFPQAFELVKILNTYAPDLIFLDMSDWNNARAVAEDIRAQEPRTAIIGFGAGWAPGKEDRCEAAGVTELLLSPVTLKTFEAGVERAIQKVRGGVQENLVVFMPAKAGSGSSTVALNIAGYLSAAPLSRKTLLIDGDLHSGLISVALGINNHCSILDALENSAQLDYSYWMKCVAGGGGKLDVLVSDRTRRETLPSWTDYHHLLDFAASRYDQILVDLPEVVNDATVEIVRRAKRVFVVCTSEPASLTLARQRCAELERRGISPEKIGLLLNRWHRGDPGAKELESQLKRHVSGVFGNDYQAVRKATNGHTFVNPDSTLGKSFATFARALAGAPDDGGGKGFLRALGARSIPQPSI
jgi:MinD-like ATPase involved in chromosome partitioning or flagellar assembly